MTIDRNPSAGTVGLSHATRLIRGRHPLRVRDDAAQARDDLAELMAEGCPSVSEAARRMGVSQKRADLYWQAIKDGLGGAQCR